MTACALNIWGMIVILTTFTDIYQEGKEKKMNLDGVTVIHLGERVGFFLDISMSID